MEPWAKEVAEKTGGKVKPELYYNAALGFKGPEILRAMSEGATECGAVCTGHVVGDWPEIGVMDLPSLFSSPTNMYEKGWLAAQKDLDKAFEEQWGLKILMFISADEQIVLSKKPLTKLEDLKGQKIRSFYPALSDMLQGFGASAVTVAYNEMYSALERGVVDGACTGFMAHVSLHNYEVTKYGLWNIGLGGFSPNFVVVPMKEWNALSADTQKVLMELRDKYSELCCKEIAEKMGTESRKTLEQKGVQMTKASDQEVAKAREFARNDVWKKWQSQVKPLGQQLLDVMLK
jgi:TRAP-type C4-dicarboxylate transport system substrate-binding protein